MFVFLLILGELLGPVPTQGDLSGGRDEEKERGHGNRGREMNPSIHFPEASSTPVTYSVLGNG